MSALSLIWASSAAGAAIFFGLGYFTRALRLARGEPDEAEREAPAPVARPAAAHDRGARAVELEQSLAEATGRLEASESALARASQEVDALRRRLVAAERARESERTEEAAGSRAEAPGDDGAEADPAARATAKELRGRIADLRHDNALLRIEAERRAEAGAELEKARQARDEAERRLRSVETETFTLRSEAGRTDDLARKLEAVERRNALLQDSARRADEAEEELRRARQDLDSLRRELRDLRLRGEPGAAEAPGSAAESAELDRARAEIGALRADVRRVEMRSAELDLLRDDNRALRAELAQLERLRRVPAEEAEAETRKLRRRISALEEQLAASGADWGSGAFEARQERDRVSSLGIDSALGSLAASAGLEAVVLADDMGLVISGSGRSETFEGLAVVASVARLMASRARDLLPVGVVRHLVLEDDGQRVVACRMFRSPEASFGLSMLGRKSPPPRPLVEEHLVSLLRSLT